MNPNDDIVLLQQRVIELSALTAVQSFLMEFVYVNLAVDKMGGSLEKFDKTMASIRALAAKPPKKLAPMAEDEVDEVHATSLVYLDSFIRQTRERLQDGLREQGRGPTT